MPIEGRGLLEADWVDREMKPNEIRIARWRHGLTASEFTTVRDAMRPLPTACGDLCADDVGVCLIEIREDEDTFRRERLCIPLAADPNVSAFDTIWLNAMERIRGAFDQHGLPADLWPVNAYDWMLH